MARKTYTREFKIQALKMITGQGLSVAEVARRLGVTEGCLRAWKTAAAEHGDAAFPGNGNPTPAEDELRRRRGSGVVAEVEGGFLPVVEGEHVAVRAGEPVAAGHLAVG